MSRAQWLAIRHAYRVARRHDLRDDPYADRRDPMRASFAECFLREQTPAIRAALDPRPAPYSMRQHQIRILRADVANRREKRAAVERALEQMRAIDAEVATLRGAA
jgi:hypothetical protein